ncbi:MAG: diacylglycerol kinase family protein [Pirellulales bacterium]
MTSGGELASNGARRILIAANPISGARPSSGTIERLQSLLIDAGYNVVILRERDGLAEAAERSLHDGELRAVVAAGGDGTVGRVVNQTPPGVPLAVLPMGTENLVARYLGQQRGADAVFQTLHRGHLIRMDAGSANGRLFVLMCSAGLDAEVVHRLHIARRGHITRLSYAKPLLQTIRSYGYPELTLSVQCTDGESAQQPQPVSARWVVVVNVPLYGLGLNFAPQADPADGQLDVCTLSRGSTWSGMWFLWRVRRGLHIGRADCTLRQCAALRIESAGDVAYQVDGDPGGRLPIDIEAVPGRLKFVVPPEAAAKWGDSAVLFAAWPGVEGRP